MTEPVDWIPPDTLNHIRALHAEGEESDRRRAELGSRVQNIPGPLGDLLRTIALTYRDFLDAYEMRATTEGEAIRVEQITDSAVELQRLWWGDAE